MKLFIILATATLLIAATQATYPRDEGFDLGETQMSSKCMRQVKMNEPHLKKCNRYIAMDILDDKYAEALSRVEGEGCKSEESCMRGCCVAMKEMDDECVCEWMKMMVENQKGRIGERLIKEGVRDLKELPSKCGLSELECGSRGNRYFV
uniref:2S seed storage albumin protein n=1 Tax=Fagopyrum esculentum TaxID=3617 RepID=2SS_FAGES|nr:RecName: Full=2S seed storage albumin protein; AltName: Full=16 kDa buckwheat protein; Short=BWp16; AltName: Full=2S albumin; AltName: Full=2S seed storage protein; AltName: Full=Buckwheat 16 kDa major allergen; AltName: Allergen=Fag e 2.0101; Flags: Precursor [Fagopyrum esculentum]ABC18306.1 16 kDa allergen [Fagopyrum esculentum]ACJ48243.1 16 kDa major allergen [Fagopyrum esculentum]